MDESPGICSFDRSDKETWMRRNVTRSAIASNEFVRAIFRFDARRFEGQHSRSLSHANGLKWAMRDGECFMSVIGKDH
jgi:hypothetical protein